MRLSRTYPILFLLVLLALSGCKSSKSLTSPTVEWTKASVPFKLNIEGNISPSGKVYMARGESIYISVKYIGMEVMSFYADNDSVFLYDKMQNVLVADRLGNNPITGKQMDVNQLQDLLFGMGSSGRPLQLKVKNLDIFLTPKDITRTKSVSLTGQWDILVRNRNTGKEMKAQMKWNYSEADWDPSKINIWKRPSKPKITVGIDQLYNIIANQF